MLVYIIVVTTLTFVNTFYLYYLLKHNFTCLLAGPTPVTQGYMDQPPPYPGPPIQQYEAHQPAGHFGDTSTGKMEYQTQPAYNPNAPV